MLLGFFEFGEFSRNKDSIRRDLALFVLPMKTLKKENWNKNNGWTKFSICSWRFYIIFSVSRSSVCWFFLLLSIAFGSNAHLDAEFEITCIVTYGKDEANKILFEKIIELNKKKKQCVLGKSCVRTALIPSNTCTRWMNWDIVKMPSNINSNSSSSQSNRKVFEMVVNWHRHSHLVLRGQRYDSCAFSRAGISHNSSGCLLAIEHFQQWFYGRFTCSPSRRSDTQIIFNFTIFFTLKFANLSECKSF